DMSGNVFEWVNDYYGGTYAVPQGTDPTGPAIDSQKRRVLLGGDYLSDSKYCLLSYRSYAKQATAGSNYCFRLAL
ncbi:MAG: SUMF1/EgtB/PvdO family nonheme iron enzyme, partial [Bacteroidales bacterium]|nr:SUMF1/EgtB/PvdO family nonheme iron enzyme [Bacteroidales bacterium]